MFPIWRHYVNDEAQSSDDAVYKLNLPNVGALFGMLVKVQCTNGSTAGRDVNILDVVDEIEVIGDGSTVLFSLYPTELEKWYETLQGKALQAVQNEAASAVQEMVFPVMFGDGLFDPAKFLQLGSFSQVKLEITYSPNIAADAGFTAGTTKFDVMLLIDPAHDGQPREGTLVTRRINAYTSVASGEQEIELPSNSMIREIGNYVYETNLADGTNVSKVVLEDKASGMKLFEADWDDFIHLNRELYGAEIVHMWRLLAQNNDTLKTRIGEMLGYDIDVHHAVDTTDDSFQIARIDTHTGDQITLDVNDVDVTAGSEVIGAHAADLDIFLKVVGKSPSFFGLIPFDYGPESGGYLNTADFGKLAVIHTQGNAGAACYVSIRELRRF